MTDDAFYLQRRRRGGSPSATLEPLWIQGRHFVTANPQDFQGYTIYKGFHITAFRSLELYLQGKFDQLAVWHKWLRSLGITGQRVFAHHNPGHDKFDPRDYDHYYDRLFEYFQWMVTEGFRVHFTALLGAVPGFDPFLTYEDQQEHLSLCSSVLSAATTDGRYHLLEYVNEGEDNGEADYVFRFLHEAPNLCARTRYWYFNDVEAAAQLDWTTLHPERKDPDNVVRQMRGLNELTQASGKPIIAGEPEQVERMRADQQAPYTALALMFGEAMTLHGAWESLQQCKIPTGEALKGCELAAKLVASNIVPAEASDWAYTRDEGSALVYPGPDVVQHHYQMSDGHTAIVGITEPHFPYPHQAQPGWRIVQDEGCAVLLEHL